MKVIQVERIRVSDAQHAAVAAAIRDGRASRCRAGWWARLARRVGQLWCGMRTGHLYIRQRQGDRYRLECWHCGHVSPGWDLRIDE